jgi:glycosyltransferase involved in cell wall biosynthesis
VGEKPTLLLIGPTPPPHHGVAMVTRALLESPLGDQFDLAHLDISDRRGIDHVDHPDLHDVVLFIRHWFGLLAVVIRRRPHVVYIPISQSTVGFLRDTLLMWPCALSGVRVVLHLHGGNFRAWYEDRGTMMRAYVRSVLGRVARMIVLGESLRGLFSGLMPATQVAAVSNGIAWDTAPPARRFAPRKRRYRVLYVGTLNRQKGTLALLAAIPRVQAVRQDVEFTFAGQWSNRQDRDEAEAVLADRNINDVTSFPGLVEGAEKRALFASADVFIFPGIQQEGQPLVILEAMAAGIPVVFTNRGCLRETVADAGVEVEHDNPRALSERILWLLDRPDEMERMGRAGRRRYERLYTQDLFVARMAGLFVSVSGEG